MITTADLLAAIGAHLTEFELPASASVHVTASLSAPQVTVQLTCHEPSAIAQGLLAWADTLAEVTARAWRVPRGDSVHLSVTGLWPRGASVLSTAAMGPPTAVSALVWHPMPPRSSRYRCCATQPSSRK
jgi:hypothetical protein